MHLSEPLNHYSSGVFARNSVWLEVEFLNPLLFIGVSSDTMRFSESYKI